MVQQVSSQHHSWEWLIAKVMTTKMITRIERFWIDLFGLYILFSHFRPRDATRGNSFFQMSSYARANLRITNDKTKGKFPWGHHVVWNGKTKCTSRKGLLTVEKPKPKQLLRPITTGAVRAMNQSQFLAIITCNSLGAREKWRVHGAILVLILIGWKPGASLLSQSLSVAIAIT